MVTHTKNTATYKLVNWALGLGNASARLFNFASLSSALLASFSSALFASFSSALQFRQPACKPMQCVYTGRMCLGVHIPPLWIHERLGTDDSCNRVVYDFGLVSAQFLGRCQCSACHSWFRCLVVCCSRRPYHITRAVRGSNAFRSRAIVLSFIGKFSNGANV